MENEFLQYQKILERPYKGIGCYTMSFIIILGLCIGLYYWFVNDIIFDYHTISPFVGFLILTLSGVILSLILLGISSYVYRDYNKEIDDVKEKLELIIKNNEGSKEELFFMKKILIEYKLRNGQCTRPDYTWYSYYFCVGCGRKKQSPTEYFPNYKYTVKKAETWRKGPMRYDQTFTKTLNIPVCKDCYEKLKYYDKVTKYNNRIVNIVKFFIYLLFAMYLVIFEFNDETILWTIIYTILSTLLFVGIVNGTPVWLLMEIVSYGISKPFLRKNEFKPFIDFDKIPYIKEFYDKDNHKK